MDILKRDLAPISGDAWNEINTRTKDVLNAYLSARKVVHVTEPKGFEYTVLSEGRLDNVNGKENEVCYGTYKVRPLTEARMEFTLRRWELDNLERGAKDIELDSLEEAVKKIALFEENAIYKGLESAMVDGLTTSSSQKPLSFGKDSEAIIDAISSGILALKKAYTTKPYTLVVGKEGFKRLNKTMNGYPLVKYIEDLLGSKVVFSHVLDGALLLPYNHEDLEMTIGQDLSIGYQSNDNEKVKFFITESFTFRVLDPSLIVPFKM